KPVSVEKLIHPYIAISRQSGIPAGEIARSVAEQLHWHLLDREVLEYLAQNHQWSEASLESVDERPGSWFRETLGHWLDQRLVTSAEFVRATAHVFLLAAQHEPTVFVGRGAQFVLPPNRGLAVRLIASKRSRIARLMAAQSRDHAQASQVVEKTDRDRAEYVQTYFHRDVADAHNYDLTINLDQFSSDEAAGMIVAACRLRFNAANTAS
ncbi:MAG TPA: cytidylate kinase-like family protein, partial [Lacipirellula sp.]